MILVTLGTHPSPMDRIVAVVDEVAERTGEEVIVQAAAFRLRPRTARAESVVSQQQLRAWVEQARAIVTHGGPGSIMLVLAAGKRPLVVPRDPSLGEHVDDHQVRFVRWLAQRRPIVPVERAEDLPMHLSGLAGGSGVDGDHAAALDHVVSRLRRLTGGPR